MHTLVFISAGVQTLCPLPWSFQVFILGNCHFIKAIFFLLDVLKDSNSAGEKLQIMQMILFVIVKDGCLTQIGALCNVGEREHIKLF